MVEWDHWSTFKLRLMSSAGTELYRWEPPVGTVWPMKIDVRWPKVEEQRTTVSESNYPVLRGWRGVVTMTLLVQDGHFPSSGIYADLEDVIGAQVEYAGSYHEMYLAALSPDGWTRVNLVSGWEPDIIGKDAGQQITLEFETALLRTTRFPPRDETFTISVGI